MKTRLFLFTIMTLNLSLILSTCGEFTLNESEFENGNPETYGDVFSTDISENSSNAAIEIKEGVFLDSAVAGIAYVSGEQTGTTDANGTFKYENENTVTLSIGNIVIGQCLGEGTITPLSLVEEAISPSHPTVANISRFLQTLDDDGDPSNGINITEAVTNAVAQTGKSIAFNVSTEDFESNIEVQVVVSAVVQQTAETGGIQTLVSVEDAISHLGAILAEVQQSCENVCVPQNPADGITFIDTDLDVNEISGIVSISIASDERDITHYVLYWGENTTTKLSDTPEIISLEKADANLTYTFASDTILPTGATHLLIFTKNDMGEIKTGVSTEIVDVFIPGNAAQGITFADIDIDSGQIAGTVNINKASDESNITHYVLYWGSDTSTKLSGQEVIATISKTGNDLTYSINSDTFIPLRATHLLVFTSNSNGEMLAGINVAITDTKIPTNSANNVTFSDTDTDNGQIGGTVMISKASDESNITHYVLYWGSDASTKLSGQEVITTTAKTGDDLTFSISSDTSIPSGATHILVFTKNENGEMTTGENLTLPMDKSRGFLGLGRNRSNISTS